MRSLGGQIAVQARIQRVLALWQVAHFFGLVLVLDLVGQGQLVFRPGCGTRCSARPSSAGGCWGSQLWMSSIGDASFLGGPIRAKAESESWQSRQILLSWATILCGSRSLLARAMV